MPSDRSYEVARLVVPRVGRVVERSERLPGWELQDPLEQSVAPVQQYLTDFAARDMSAASVRSYALDLLRWFRLMWAFGIEWDRATADETRDFVLWMRQARKNRATQPRKHVPGSVNVLTGKRYSGDGYSARTINHNLTVVREFYQFHIEAGRGPARNPVPIRRNARSTARFAAHLNPMDKFPSVGRSAYRQKVPANVPRSIPDLAMDDLLAWLKNHRDRALIAFYLSTGARASELLSVTNNMVDPTNQLIAVIRKGSRRQQWLPASPDAFMWLSLFQAQLPEDHSRPDAPVWWSLRKPYRPLNYAAARAVFCRANDGCGTNWSLHDLRHTAAVRMLADPSMTLSDVQTILGHEWITSTQVYLTPRDKEVFARAHTYFQRLREKAAGQAELSTGQMPNDPLIYEQQDIDELFGGRR